jgi:hypothetical protein
MGRIDYSKYMGKSDVCYVRWLYVCASSPSYSYVPLGVVRYLLNSELHMHGLVSRYFRL